MPKSHIIVCGLLVAGFFAIDRKLKVLYDGTNDLIHKMCNVHSSGLGSMLV